MLIANGNCLCNNMMIFLNLLQGIREIMLFKLFIKCKCNFQIKKESKIMEINLSRANNDAALMLELLYANES